MRNAHGYAVITGPDGCLYVALEVPGPENPGCIIRLAPANPLPGALQFAP